MLVVGAGLNVPPLGRDGAGLNVPPLGTEGAAGDTTGGKVAGAIVMGPKLAGARLTGSIVALLEGESVGESVRDSVGITVGKSVGSRLEGCLVGLGEDGLLVTGIDKGLCVGNGLGGIVPDPISTTLRTSSMAFKTPRSVNNRNVRSNAITNSVVVGARNKFAFTGQIQLILGESVENARDSDDDIIVVVGLSANDPLRDSKDSSRSFSVIPGGGDCCFCFLR
jgi:hypothetical protein